ncbi:VIT domain-containing protein [Nocardia sp. NPDC057668]|uniref:VIT domain-containing protein n=1 Tax=Nocardia sp. NPDC057668 TaxID=3346202 RepID=UPI00366CF523
MTAIPTVIDEELTRIAGPRTGDELVTGVLRAADGVHGGLPLVAMDVHAAVTGLVATTTVRQVFRNTLGTGIEAVYIFPLPDRAAVTSFTADLAGRRIEGELQERQAARDAYDAAVAVGHRAALAEEERPGVFTTTVGNLQPGEEATLTLVLTGPLPVDGGEATLRFPLVVAPRYIPGTPLDGAQAGAGTALDTGAVPDASRISPPVLLPGQSSPVALSLTATIDPAGLGPVTVRSSLHAVATESEGGTTVVRLHPGERLNRDVVLRLALAAESELTCAAVIAEDIVQVTLVPELTATRRDRDVVVLLDRSGSMDGWKMVAARRAAARVVDTLTDRDRFAVLAFDHYVERPTGLATGLVPALDRNRFAAVGWLSGLEARGGTELAGPLEQSADLLHADEGRDRVLVLVTDGQIGDEDRVLARITPRLNGTRVFTLGIDRAVNAGFLQRLAATGAGRCELVETEDRLDEVLTGIHRRIAPPVLTDVVVEIDGRPVTDPAPAHSDLFEGSPLLLGGSVGDATGDVIVRAKTATGEPFSTKITPVRTDDKAVRAVWARARLRDLEDAYAAGTGEVTPTNIVEFSLAHGVLSRFTAFIAVDHSRKTTGDHHTVVQPVEAPDGWVESDADVSVPSFMLRGGAPMPAHAYEAASDSAYGGAPAFAPGSPAPAGPPPPIPAPMSAPRPMNPAGAPPPPQPSAPWGSPAGMPRPAPGSAPMFARRRARKSFAPASSEATPQLDVVLPFLDRLRALLETPDATAATNLADELASAGASADLVSALHRLAAAITDTDAKAVTAAIGEIRTLRTELAAPPVPKPRRGFWH